MKISKIKKNPDNPRIIRDERFELLKNSIERFPQMMRLRRIVIDENNMILGGNMRYHAVVALGYKEIPDEWIERAENLTDEQKREFIAKDNASFGEWDWEKLANEWDAAELADFGVDVPTYAPIAAADRRELLTPEIVEHFKEKNFYQAIETSGLLPVPANLDWISVSPKVAEHVVKKNFPNGVSEADRRLQNRRADQTRVFAANLCGEREIKPRVCEIKPRVCETSDAKMQKHFAFLHQETAPQSPQHIVLTRSKQLGLIDANI